MSTTTTTPEPVRQSSAEAAISFDCFGGRCSLAAERGAEAAVWRAREFLLRCHRSLSRFQAHSELSRLNANPAAEVSVSPLLAAALAAALEAARLTGGLVDPTLLEPIERAGYERSLRGHRPLQLAELTASSAPRRPGTPDPRQRWREIELDAGRGLVRRPPGLGIDLGGSAKGWAADRCAAILARAGARAADCCGDVRVAGAVTREVRITGPEGGRTLHRYWLRDAGVATSGLGRRSWRAADGSAAHHLLDPASGEPCFSGLVQATALAPTALEAEARAKAALLSGPQGCGQWLPHGGLVIDEAGELDLYEQGVSR